MTGYCSKREQTGETTLIVEIKSLNHKGYDLHFHTSRSMAMLEIPIRDRLKKSLRRGRIELFLKAIDGFGSGGTIRPNTAIAHQYLDAVRTVVAELQLDEQPDLGFILAQDGVLDQEEDELSPEEGWAMVEGLFDRSIDALLAMKWNEGKRLKTELESLLAQITDLNAQVISHRETVIQEYREKLLTRIDEVKEKLEIDEIRILQEVALFADRSDIQEETVRLDSHIQQFHEMLNENTEEGKYTAVGRRLDFLCQEMFREINTIGSKSASLDVTRLGLSMKGIIEQIREQVQNVE